MMSKEHFETLQKDVSALHSELAALGQSGEIEALLKIIRRPPPGWTTIAEIALTQEIVNTLRTQTKMMASLQSGLLSAAKLVSAK
jgi:hypothetical protein